MVLLPYALNCVSVRYILFCLSHRPPAPLFPALGTIRSEYVYEFECGYCFSDLMCVFEIITCHTNLTCS